MPKFSWLELSFRLVTKKLMMTSEQTTNVRRRRRRRRRRRWCCCCWAYLTFWYDAETNRAPMFKPKSILGQLSLSSSFNNLNSGQSSFKVQIEPLVALPFWKLSPHELTNKLMGLMLLFGPGYYCDACLTAPIHKMYKLMLYLMYKQPLYCGVAETQSKHCKIRNAQQCIL